MRIVPSEDYAGHCASAKKFSKLVSKKLEFGHLRVKGEYDDDDPRAEKIFRRWCHFARFFPCGGEGCLAKFAARLSLWQKNYAQVFPKSLIFAIYRR